jgi:hypothetical protein
VNIDKSTLAMRRNAVISPRETILTVLHTRLSAQPATVLRGEVLPERVPTVGLLILRDGEPGSRR